MILRNTKVMMEYTKYNVTISWWKARKNNSDASQIAVSPPFLSTWLSHQHLSYKLGIKLFSVSASEMCDERTASMIAACSTAKRNGLAADYIIKMGILEKYWKYDLNTSNCAVEVILISAN
jgi:hypothetical protein